MKESVLFCYCIGSYLPNAYEEVVDVVNAYVLTEKQALHMYASKTFTDDFGKVRRSGEEWLITMKDTETHIPGVYEQVRNATLFLHDLITYPYCTVSLLLRLPILSECRTLLLYPLAPFSSLLRANPTLGGLFIFLSLRDSVDQLL